jgi:hypothetical protein
MCVPISVPMCRDEWGDERSDEASSPATGTGSAAMSLTVSLAMTTAANILGDPFSPATRARPPRGLEIWRRSGVTGRPAVAGPIESGVLPLPLVSLRIHSGLIRHKTVTSMPTRPSTYPRSPWPRAASMKTDAQRAASDN